jgi:hypothetical protein
MRLGGFNYREETNYDDPYVLNLFKQGLSEHALDLFERGAPDVLMQDHGFS